MKEATRRGDAMARSIHPGRFVTFVQDYTQVTPATILEGYEPRTGLKYKIADIPERVTEYKAGQELQFGSVNAAKEFVKALGPVCRVGRAA